MPQEPTHRISVDEALVFCHACFDELAEVFVAQPPSAGLLPKHSGGPLCHRSQPIELALTEH